MPHHLFLFTIGPVQGFISQAKRTHDLYAGSKLLTNLCMAGINALPTGWMPVFPDFDASKTLAEVSYPNRFIAYCEDIHKQDLQKIGEEVEIAVRREWLNIQTKIWNDNKITMLPLGAQEQLDRHLEIYWLFSSADAYAKAYQDIESTMGAIKNARQFVQLEEQGRKCMLDGERDVRFFKEGDKQKSYKFKLPQYHENRESVVSLPHIAPSKLRPEEGLSAVSFVKRCFEVESTGKKEFPSTAEISLAYTFDKLKNDDTWKALHSAFLTSIPNVEANNEWQLYYEENLSAQYFEKNFEKNFEIKKEDKDFEQAKKYLVKLRDYAKENNARFTSYYAILIFDGDGMGEWLSGKTDDGNYFVAEDRLKDYHTALSGALQKFSGVAKAIVQLYQGAVVYCGGDDFLGFCNIENALKMLNELRSEFSAIIMQDIDDYIDKTVKSDKITFSCGFAIAHYKAPLSEVLNKARELEKKAKNMEGKDALALGVMKHSGEVEEAVYKFEAEVKDKEGSPMKKLLINALNEIVAQLQSGSFSNAFIHKLCQQFQLFKDREDDIQIVVPEMKRLLKRSQNKDTDANEALMLSAVSYLFAQNLIHKQKLENALNALSICDFLLRNGAQSKASVSIQPQTIL